MNPVVRAVLVGAFVLLLLVGLWYLLQHEFKLQSPWPLVLVLLLGIGALLYGGYRGGAV